jgi:hypothetical protein
MRGHFFLPIKLVNRERWGDLGSLALSHEICGERVDQRKDMSFAGGHRVRLYKFTKNVHWKIPTGVELDISEVPPSAPPRRKQKRR